jgi:hypothetical protein
MKSERVVVSAGFLLAAIALFMGTFLASPLPKPAPHLCAEGSDVVLWGCKDGERMAWMVVEVDCKDEARRIVPPAFRAQAKVVQLNAFTMKDIEDILHHHEP